ncbi:VWA domain-containing protein [Paraliomyxa miuraensis]|uniref:VWA domain-containing protein n=1 Tax=Paraliomyxa miuraensis TaxID=376150 RepID=UPI002255DC3E|nr:VWA domain-containing protein [Paraliomyxa miuraensis]MCX4247817.1 VWA domain-containing protein [Paraliomyxa miuraensis]
MLEPVELPPGMHDPHYPALFINKDVDVLFVIDNSGSMTEEQAMLAAGIGAFFEVLERPDVAANYRIAFTTTDDGNPWCSDTTPEAGQLQLSSCRSRPEEFVFPDPVIDPVGDACSEHCPEAWAEIETLPTTVWGDDQAAPRPWMERIDGATNLPKGLSTVQAFQCLAPQGIVGCGFESPLEAMWKALRRSATDGDPAQGFVRDDAILSVVIVTDEIDCSDNDAAESMFLPEGNRVFWSDPDAEAPTSAVCWNAGVLCEGLGTYDDCRSIDLDVDGNEVAADDAEELAALRPVSRYVQALQDLENYKQRITPDQEVLVSVIGGFASDGSVTYADAVDDPTFQSDFGIGPGCESANGRAVPPVRMRELAEAFAVGNARNLFSVCDDGPSWSASLATIAQNIAAQIRPTCFPACVADFEPDTPDTLEPSCRFVQEAPQPDGSFEETVVLPCEADRSLPEGEDVCFVMLVEDERSEFCAEIGFNLELEFVRREGVAVPPGTAMTGECNLSDDRETDCPEL